MTRLKDYRIWNQAIAVEDPAQLPIADIVAGELRRDCYGIRNISFKPGDIVVDVGANIGLFSICLALAFPCIRVIGLEPVSELFEVAKRNIIRNGVTNVALDNLGVSRHGGHLYLSANHENGGSYSSFANSLTYLPQICKAVTLDEIFNKYNVKTCRLLKIDVEGAEHEVLTDASCLDKVDYISGECHINENLRAKGFSYSALMKHLLSHIPRERIWFESVYMSE